MTDHPTHYPGEHLYRTPSAEEFYNLYLLHANERDRERHHHGDPFALFETIVRCHRGKRFPPQWALQALSEFGATYLRKRGKVKLDELFGSPRRTRGIWTVSTTQAINERQLFFGSMMRSLIAICRPGEDAPRRIRNEAAMMVNEWAKHRKLPGLKPIGLRQLLRVYSKRRAEIEQAPDMAAGDRGGFLSMFDFIPKSQLSVKTQAVFSRLCPPQRILSAVEDAELTSRCAGEFNAIKRLQRKYGTLDHYIAIERARLTGTLLQIP